MEVSLRRGNEILSYLKPDTMTLFDVINYFIKCGLDKDEICRYLDNVTSFDQFYELIRNMPKIYQKKEEERRKREKERNKQEERRFWGAVSIEKEKREIEAKSYPQSFHIPDTYHSNEAGIKYGSIRDIKAAYKDMTGKILPDINFCYSGISEDMEYIENIFKSCRRK